MIEGQTVSLYRFWKKNFKLRLWTTWDTYISQYNGEPGRPPQNFFLVGCRVWNIFCSVISSRMKCFGSNEVLSNIAGTATEIYSWRPAWNFRLRLTCIWWNRDSFSAFGYKFSILIWISYKMTINRFLKKLIWKVFSTKLTVGEIQWFLIFHERPTPADQGQCGFDRG